MPNLKLMGAFAWITAFTLWLFSYVYGLDILNPRQVSWILGNDPSQAFYGLNFFLQEPLQWPPGGIQTYHSPFGTSLVYTDSIPLLGILLKGLVKILNLQGPFQISGIWMLACLLLQGWIGLRLFLKEGFGAGQSLIASLFLVAWPALHRRSIGTTQHYTLMAHFIVLAGISLLLDWILRQRFSRLAWWSLLALSLGVHFYLFAMIALMYTVPFFERPKHLRMELLLATLLGFLAYSFGYFVISAGESQGMGFGYFSMDLFSFFSKEGSSLTEEGFNYLGAGLILFSLAALVLKTIAKPIRIKEWISRYPVRACFLAFWILLALSSRIGIFGYRLPLILNVFVELGVFYWLFRVSHPNPKVFKCMGFATGVTIVFHGVGPALRSSGRFGWALGYGVLIGAMLLWRGILKSREPRLLTSVLAFVFGIQSWDLAPLLKRVQNEMPKPTLGNKNLEISPDLEAALGFNPARVVLLGPDSFSPPGLLAWALKHRTPIGPVYLARSNRRERNLYTEEKRNQLNLGILPKDEVVAVEPGSNLNLSSSYRRIPFAGFDLVFQARVQSE